MRNDAFLYYNIPGWEALGLAVPNFGDDTGSQNSTILQLTQMMGRNLQNIMFHTDARLRTPPSVNTLFRIHKLCVRARSILSSRAVAPGTSNMESAHANPANEQFIVYPVPYFTVRNQWMKEWCGLTMLALTEAFQHQENGRPLEISLNFAALVGQYIQRIYRMMGTELLQIDPKKFDDLSFTLTDEDIRKYDPAKFFTLTEMIDTPPREYDVPTEDDLLIITNGIPVNQLPPLSRWLGYADLSVVPGTNSTGNAVGGNVAGSDSSNNFTGSFVPPPTA